MTMTCRTGDADMSLAVIQAVARRFCVTPIGMIGRERRAILVDARSIATYIMREHYAMSYPAIGKRLGGRDHSTIINQYERAKRMIDESAALAEYVASHLNSPRLPPTFAPLIFQLVPASVVYPQLSTTIFPPTSEPPKPQKRERNIDDSDEGIRTEGVMAAANNAMLAALAAARGNIASMEAQSTA